MPNGKPGDHPLTDILNHELEVYSAHADKLVREIGNLADENTRRELGDRLYQEYNPYGSPDISKLGGVGTTSFALEPIDIQDESSFVHDIIPTGSSRLKLNF